jgi:hypothetical protein
MVGEPRGRDETTRAVSHGSASWSSGFLHNGASRRTKELAKMSNVVGFPAQIQAPPLVDDPSVSEVFTDNVAGLTVVQGNVNITFATVRADHTKTPATNLRKITSRLVMPISAAVQLHEMLGQMFKDLEAKGIIQRTPIPASPSPLN